MEIENSNLEVVEFEGNDIDFIIFVKGLRKEGKADLKIVNAKFKWVVTRDDGSQYILIPKQNEKIS